MTKNHDYIVWRLNKTGLVTITAKPSHLFTVDRNYINWLALLIVSTIGIGVSLYGYNQIINITPPASLNTNQFPNKISVFSPKMSDAIENPVEISGQAMTSERKLLLLVKDKFGNILGQTILVTPKTKLSPFGATISYTHPSTKTGFVEVSAYNSALEEGVSKKVILISFED